EVIDQECDVRLKRPGLYPGEEGDIVHPFLGGKREDVEEGDHANHKGSEHRQTADAADGPFILDRIAAQTVNQKSDQGEKGYKPDIIEHSQLLLTFSR